jgi:hypothetical protein
MSDLSMESHAETACPKAEIPEKDKLEKAAPKEEIAEKEELKKLTAAEFRAYNTMAEKMEYFVCFPKPFIQLHD